AAIAAKPLADTQLKAHVIRRPGQVSPGAFVVTMDTLRRDGAERTRARALGRAYPQGELCRASIDVTRVKAQRGGIREQGGKDCTRLCGAESGFLLKAKATRSLGQCKGHGLQASG